MNDSEVDMEELEARLYGQVYHTSKVNEDLASKCQLRHDIPTKSFSRYFEQRQQNVPPPPYYQRMDLNPYLMLNPNVNSIVVLPSQPTQIFTPQQDSQKWLEKILTRYEKSRHKNKQKKLRRKLRQKEAQARAKSKKVEKPVSNNEETVKVIEAVPKDEESFVVIDDDSDADTTTSDVILIETPNEVISIDCEDVEFVQPDTQQVVEEASAASNDFVDVALPTKSKDKCGVASSNSSTVDYTENFSGNKFLFDFGSSNNFSALNLDSFTDYIECDGKTSGNIPSLSSSLLEKNDRGRRLENCSVENSSDSSSESEYEEDGLESVSTSSFSASIPTGSNSTPRKQKSLTDEDNVITIEQSDEEVEVEEDSPDIKKFKLDVIDTKKSKEESLIQLEGSDNEFICIDEDNSSSSIELCLNESDKCNINSEKILNVDEGDVDYPEKKQSSRPKRFVDYWTEDMDKFYKESWGHEDFDVIEEQRKMSDNPNMWKILPRDRVNINCLGKQPRCRRCREFGHIAVKCTKRLDPPKCILCGASGHFESRCPDKMCTSCGRKSNYFTTYCSVCATRRYVKCSICSMKGHLFHNCPDLWRRYLFTTTNSEVVTQPTEANLKRLEDQWCAGCGRNGHFEQNCCYYNRSHLPASVFIHDYSDVYTEKSATVTQRPALVSLTETQTGNATDLIKDSSNSLSWQLNPKHQKRLILVGATFLKTVEKMLKVNVSINGTHCCITGSKSNRVKAKMAVNTFCTNADLLKHIRIDNFSFKSHVCNMQNLEENFSYLENLTVNWQKVGETIYNDIMLHEHVSTEELYRKLNTIINAKLQLGQAKNHMKILKRCLEDKRDVTLKSFQYIFNNSKELTGNYENLISQLPWHESQGEFSGSLEIERLRKTMEHHPKFEIIDEFYHLVIINEYSDSSVSNFKTAIWQALAQVTKNTKRKKRGFRKKVQNFSFSC